LIEKVPLYLATHIGHSLFSIVPCELIDVGGALDAPCQTTASAFERSEVWAAHPPGFMKILGFLIVVR
jgi:hypothetical protein